MHVSKQTPLEVPETDSSQLAWNQHPTSTSGMIESTEPQNGTLATPSLGLHNLTPPIKILGLPA
jgi:hypothetical protein